MYTYPEKDQPGDFLGALGSVWLHYYGGKAPLLALVQADCELLKQQQQNLKETAACASRFDVPTEHVEIWTAMEFHRSTSTNDFVTCFPKPPGLVEMPLLLNRMTNPTRMLQSGMDYVIHEKVVQFVNCPFDDPGIPQADDVCYLWGFRGKYDRAFVERTFGHIMGLPKQGTSQQYKDTVNAVADCVTQGCTMANLTTLIAHALDVPVADGEEMILGDAHDHRGRFLITDKHIYRCHDYPDISVPLGSKPAAGTPLLDVFRVLPWHMAPHGEVIVPAGMVNGPTRTTPRHELELDSAILIQMPAGLTEGCALHLSKVLPPQVGVIFADYQGGHDARDHHCDADDDGSELSGGNGGS